MQHAGGMLLPPVQKLVATIISAPLGQKCKRIPHPLKKPNAKAFVFFFTIHFPHLFPAAIPILEHTEVVLCLDILLLQRCFPVGNLEDSFHRLLRPVFFA